MPTLAPTSFKNGREARTASNVRLPKAVISGHALARAGGRRQSGAPSLEAATCD